MGNRWGRKIKGALAAVFLSAPPVAACDLALVLAVDVSGSVDKREYRAQMDGLAAALRDPVIAGALVEARAAVALVQWSGSTRQDLTIPWRRVESPADLGALAREVEAAPRPWRNFATAIGEVLELGMGLFAEVPDCRRRVIDISGDGRSNEGVNPGRVRAALNDAQVVVNALVIQTGDAGLVRYFRDVVINGPGAFVVPANGYAEYPARIRLKLEREVTRQVSAHWPEYIQTLPYSRLNSR